ncbi:hypothetical protein O1M54_10080 [Streptomyces diastatochromogenes]|nr:hypothetical protein [Streptomyces diastatochromogenes]
MGRRAAAAVRGAGGAGRGGGGLGAGRRTARAAAPRRRQTLLDLGRRLADPVFLVPTAALAGATAALSAGVGFLPVSGAAAGLGTVATGAAVSVLAACGAVVQPRAGRALDAGRLGLRTGLVCGLLLAAAGWPRRCCPASPASSSPRP